MPALTPPPFSAAVVTKDGQILKTWRSWFQDLRNLLGNGPFPLKSYTVAGAPAAASYEGHIIYVSNEAGGKTVAFSDGANWRRVQDRAIIS